MLGEALTLDGHSCVTAASLEDLQAREREVMGCDLALLDINLGSDQPSGVEACEWLIRRGFEGRIVFLTGHGTTHPLVVEAAKVARAQVITKPLPTRALLALAREIR